MKLALLLCLLASPMVVHSEGFEAPPLDGVFDGSVKKAPGSVDAKDGATLSLEQLRPQAKDQANCLPMIPIDARAEKTGPDLRMLAVPLGITAAALAAPLDWSQRSTQMHVGFGMAGAYIGSDIFEKLGLKPWQATLLSSALTFGVGVAKEYAFSPGGPDAKDIQADAAGVLAGAGLKFLLHF